MLIVMKAHASDEQVRGVCQKIENLGFRAHSIPGAQRGSIGITGNETEIDSGTFYLDGGRAGSHTRQQALQAGEP